MRIKLVLIIFSILSLTTSLTAQNSERILIKGRVSVDIPEIEGVTIYNATTKKGVITDAKGEFEIEVAVNDRLDVSALLYQNFSILISKEDVKQRQIIIYLIETINTLDEVVVLRYGLSGFLNKDLEQLRVVKPITMSFDLDDYTDLEMADDQFSSVENIATNQGVYYNMVDGRELVKLISKLFTKSEKYNVSIPEVTITLDDKYDSSFYIDNFKIPEDEIQAFIVYVENDAFNNLLLLPENEMELIELLNTKSQQFLTKK